MKPNRSGCDHGRGGGSAPSPGRLRLSCIAVKDLIQAAYGTFYDLDALPPGLRLDRVYGPMMQTLLEERFGLRPRREARERSVYLLTVAPGGAMLMPTVPGSCVVIRSRASAGIALPGPAASRALRPRILPARGSEAVGRGLGSDPGAVCRADSWTYRIRPPGDRSYRANRTVRHSFEFAN